MKEKQYCEREFDFSLTLATPTELTDEMADKLFEAGCDDATPSVSFGRVRLEFSRTADSYKSAILSAINDVHRAGIGASVFCIDECDLVTQAEIARRIEKSAQWVQQLVSGRRGPGGFPPPTCQISENMLLWSWCAVSDWLLDNNMIKAEVLDEALVNDAVNWVLSRNQRQTQRAELIQEVERALQESG